jgi:hypothetical protein
MSNFNPLFHSEFGLRHFLANYFRNSCGYPLMVTTVHAIILADNSESLMSLFVRRTAMTPREDKNNENAIAQNQKPSLQGAPAHPVLKNPEVNQFWWGPQYPGRC